MSKKEFEITQKQLEDVIGKNWNWKWHTNDNGTLKMMAKKMREKSGRNPPEPPLRDALTAQALGPAWAPALHVRMGDFDDPIFYIDSNPWNLDNSCKLISREA